MYTSILATLALAASTLAAPAAIEKRQGAITCGSTVSVFANPFHPLWHPLAISKHLDFHYNATQSPFDQINPTTHSPSQQSYSASQVSAAVSQGCQYYRNNQQVGSNDYPHRYNNYEGFDFRNSGPWQEFPIVRSGVYTGGE